MTKPKPGVPYGQCPTCRCWYRLTSGGKLFRHWADPFRARRCAGGTQVPRKLKEHC